MLQLINAFWDIALFRRGPQDLPYSGFLLKLTALFYVLAGVAVVILPVQRDGIVLSVLLDTLLLALLVAGALMFRHKPERIVQTLSAAYGALGLLGLISLPVVGWVLRTVSDPVAGVFPSLMFSLLYFWSIAALGNILRHGLSIPLLPGVVISVVYFQLWSFLAPALMGKPGGG